MDQPTRPTTLIHIRRALCLIALAALLVSINWLLPTLIPASSADAKAVLFVGDGEKVLRYDAASGALIDVFIEPGDQVTLRQADLLIGPDDNLYLISGLKVLRYNAITGALRDELVDLSQHGFVVAFRIARGPDGYLYVGGQNDDRILRYDGASGRFIDLFIPPGSAANIIGASFVRFWPVSVTPPRS